MPKILLKVKKLENVLESLKQLPQVHKKEQFDLFGETKTTLGGKRLFGIVLIKNILQNPCERLLFSLFNKFS